MKEYRFIFIEELKKIYRNKFIYVYACIFALNIIGICSEFYDRINSVYYSEVGVHIQGQALEYLTKYEFGYSGQLVFYLLPILFIAAPIFADEYASGMYKNIRVSKNGRILTTLAKINVVIVCQVLWCVWIAALTSIMSYVLLDIGITAIASDVKILVAYLLNTLFGMFFVAIVFMLISSLSKNTIVALGIGFAVLLAQILVEVKGIYGHFIPVIGMAANSLMERNWIETVMVWSFYIIGGLFTGGLIIRVNK